MSDVAEYMKARKVDVVIERNMYEKPTRTVYEHEIQILEDIYGDGMITRYERPILELTSIRGKKFHMKESGKNMEYQVVELDHDEEYSRLEEFYGRHPTIDESFVERNYERRNRSTLAEWGENKYKGMEVEAVDEVNRGSQGDIEQLKIVHKRELDLVKMTNSKLRQICRQNDLPLDGTENKDTLVKMVLQAEFMPTGTF